MHPGCSHALQVQSQQQRGSSCKIELQRSFCHSWHCLTSGDQEEYASACIHISQAAVVSHRAHGMPVDHLQPIHKHKAGSEHRSPDKGGQIPARHWGPTAAAAGDHEAGPAPEEEEEEEMGDSLDAFVVETRLVPVSLSQIPDQLPDHVSSSALHLST